MEAKIVVLENKVTVLADTVAEMKAEIRSLKLEIQHLTLNSVSREELKEIWDKIDELLNKLVTAEAARTQKELDLAIKEKESLQEDNKKWIFEIVKQAVGILIALGLYHFGINKGHATADDGNDTSRISATAEVVKQVAATPQLTTSLATLPEKK